MESCLNTGAGVCPFMDAKGGNILEGVVLDPGGRDDVFACQNLAWRWVTGQEQVGPQVFVNGSLE